MMGLVLPESARRTPKCEQTRVPVSMLLAWIAVIAAVYLTLLYYPGVMYTDSYGRWRVAQTPFRDNPAPDLSFVPSVFMALTYELTNNYAAFTVVQSFLFLFSCFLLVHRMTGLTGYWSLLLSLPLLLFPLWPAYSVFHESGLGAAIGMNFAMAFVLGRRAQHGSWTTLLAYLGLFVALVALFGFRLNAVTVFPVLAYAFWKKTPRATAYARCIVLVGALLFAKYLPRVLGSPEVDNSGLGFAWEIAQVLKRVPNPKYDNYLDYLGSVRGAVDGVEETMWGSFFSSAGINGHLLRAEETSKRVKRDYLRLAWMEPRAFAANKMHVIGRVLGAKRMLGFWEFDENRGDELAKFGWRSTPLRHKAFERLSAVMSTTPALSRPWIVFLVGLSACLVNWYCLRPRVRLAWVVYACSIFYYGAFLITTQSYEFRYFFPALALVAIVVVAVVARIISWFLRALQLAFEP